MFAYIPIALTLSLPPAACMAILSRSPGPPGAPGVLAAFVAPALPAFAAAQDGDPAGGGSPFGGTTYETLADGKPVQMPVEFVGNKVRVDAMVNGEGPFHLVLDTGMPTPGIVLFRSARVEALDLEDTGTRISLFGGGGEGAGSEAIVANASRVTLGDLKMSNVASLLLPEKPDFPKGMDGIIGGALFLRFVVRLDVDAHRLELIEPKSWTPPEGGAIVPLIRVPGAAFVDVRVAIDDRAPEPARVVVDLGAGHAISLNSRQDGTVAPPAVAIEAPIGNGLSGVLRGSIGRVSRLEIGPFAFENVIATFPVEEHQHPGGFDFRDGNLGAGILKRFVVSFDYEHDRLILEKGARFGDAFEHEMAGLSLQWRNDGTLRILAVLPGSPAAAAGVEAGDELLAVGGRAVDSLGADGVREALTVDGAEVALKLKREASIVEVRVRLRRLV